MRRQLLTTDSLQELIDLLRAWREMMPPDNGEADLTLSQDEAAALAWDGNS